MIKHGQLLASPNNFLINLKHTHAREPLTRTTSEVSVRRGALGRSSGPGTIYSPKTNPHLWRRAPWIELPVPPDDHIHARSRHPAT
jgi:hypothetical protein